MKIGTKLVCIRPYYAEEVGTEYIFKGEADDLEVISILEGGKPFNLPGDSHVATVGSCHIPTRMLLDYFKEA